MDGIRKLAEAYETNASVRAEEDSFTLSDNKMIRNMGFATREMAGCGRGMKQCKKQPQNCLLRHCYDSKKKSARFMGTFPELWLPR